MDRKGVCDQTPTDCRGFSPSSSEPVPVKCRSYTRTLVATTESKVNLSKEDALVRKVLCVSGVPANIINIYNNWIQTRLASHIAAKRIYLEDGFIYFDKDDINIDIQRPAINVGGDNLMPLTPKICRDRGYTYSFCVNITPKYAKLHKTDMSTYERQLLVPKESTDVDFNPKHCQLSIKLPIMLGSWVCNLTTSNGVTDESAYLAEECPNDQFGYFIIKGSERIILTRDNLRLGQIFIYPPSAKKAVECRYTCPTRSGAGTVITTLAVGKKSQQIKTGLTHLGKHPNSEKTRHIPVFVLFKLLDSDYQQNGTIQESQDFREAVEMIKYFVEPKYHNELLFVLQSSLIKARSVSIKHNGNYFNYVIEKRALGNISAEGARKKILEDIRADLFPNVDDFDTVRYTDEKTAYEVTDYNKRLHLAMMMARFCEYLMHNRSVDDRDSTGNKRFETAAKRLELRFLTLWNRIDHAVVRKGAPKTQSKTLTGNPTTVLNALITNVNKMNADIETEFAPNAWNGKNAKNKENIVDIIKRNTPFDVTNQVSHISIAANIQLKQPQIRAVQMSQLGYICPLETPEGKTCGLTKYPALSCQYSLEQNPTVINAVIDQYEDKGLSASYSREDGKTYPLLVNGVIKYWCDPSFEKELIKYRRNGTFPKDTSIFLNRRDRTVEVLCNGGRMVRPLLIVNPETGNLVIDEIKDAWSMDFDTLLKNGCIEYVDAREQEHITLAQRLEHVRDRVLRLPILEREIRNGLIAMKTESNPNVETKTGVESKVDTEALLKEWEYIREGTNAGKNMVISDFLKKIDARLPSLVIEYIRKAPLKYTHSEIDPIFILGMSASLTPFGGMNPGPRIIYNTSMSKQALGRYHTLINTRFDTSFKMMNAPTQPFVKVITHDFAGFNRMPVGTTITVAMMALDRNPEDSVILSEDSVYAGKFALTKFKTHKLVNSNTPKGGIREVLKKPILAEGESANRYHAIGEDGLPKINALIKQGDCIVGRVDECSSNIPGRPKKEINRSLFAKCWEGGFVDGVLVTTDGTGSTVVKVRLRQRRRIIRGDKITSRYSQKVTCGVIEKTENLPHIVGGPNDGVVPDAFINVHSIPGRMTVNQLKEFLMTKGFIYDTDRLNVVGASVDGTTFRKHDIEIDRETLRKTRNDLSTVEMDGGKDRNNKEVKGYVDGYETMEYSDGTRVKEKIFVGCCYYSALRHHAIDKIKSRGRGGINTITHQPDKGRARNGGLRVGEMEHDAFVSHGATGILQERLLYVSDKFTTVVCRRCGLLAVTKYGVSYYCGKDDYKDGPVRADDKTVGEKFGSITFPFAFKAVCQMLNGIGVQAYFETELVPTSDKYSEVASIHRM